MLQAQARGRLGFAPEACGAGEASVQTCVLPDADGPSGSKSVGHGENLEKKLQESRLHGRVVQLLVQQPLFSRGED